ncbi:MAG: beta-ketoacyl synthase N-terminal-like domain-containing protein [Candidatus Poribacteria bacterium]|nr:beta-ketoacyl synthase N-terminal-like domain-containing protein [Candidatus Poribacteria bacterium]
MKLNQTNTSRNVVGFDDPEIAITGIGVFSVLGTQTDLFFRCLLEKTIEPTITQRMKIKAGQLTTVLGIRDQRFRISRYMDPVAKNTIVALQQTISDAKITTELIERDPYNYALVLGALHGPHTTREKFYDAFDKKDRRLVSGTLFSHCGYNMAAALPAIAYGIKGPNLTFSAKPNLGIDLLRRASQLLKSRRVHTVFVGFSELKRDETIEDTSLKELAYILCLENKTRAIERKVNQFIEFEEIAWNGSDELSHLQSGDVYTTKKQPRFKTQPENMSNLLETLQSAEKLNYQTNRKLIVDETYLPLIKLGMLTNQLRNREQESFIFLPLLTKHRIPVITLRYSEFKDEV